MSQQKVDRYKQEKANRAKIMKKAKRMSILRRCGFTVVGLALVGWIGVSAYQLYEEKQPRNSVEVNYDAISNYMSSLTPTDEK